MPFTSVIDLFKGLGDAIRMKDGSSVLIDHQDMPSKVGPKFPYVTSGLLHYYNAIGYRDNLVVWKDLSGNAHDSTTFYFNSDGSSGWTDSGGLYYDGADDAVLVANYLPFAADGAFSCELYLKTDSATETQRVITFGDSSGRFYLEFSSASGIKIGQGASSYVVGDNTKLPAVGTLTHIVIVRDGTAFQLWMNGVMVNSGTSTLKANNNVGRGLCIGTDYSSNATSFWGTMVLHRMYNRPLTQAEIWQNYLNAINLSVAYPPPAPPAIPYAMPRLKYGIVYYGYPTSINGSAGSVSAATAVFANFDIIVFSGGLSAPEHPQHVPTEQIIANLKQLNSAVEIFGYVEIGRTVPHMTEQEIKDRIDAFVTMGFTGVFVDEFGYDYGCSRTWQNNIVDYAHNAGLKVMVNSWKCDYVFSDENIYVSYNDFYGNPTNILPHINENDYSLFEDMFYKYDPVTPAYEASRTTRIYDALYYRYAAQPRYGGLTYREKFGTKTMALDAINNNTQHFAIGYLGSKLFGIDAYAAAYTGWADPTVIIYDTPELTIDGLQLPLVTKSPYNGIRNAQYAAGECTLIWQSVTETADCPTDQGTHKFIYDSVEITSLDDLQVV